jgi:hypothetical protein
VQQTLKRAFVIPVLVVFIALVNTHVASSSEIGTLSSANPAPATAATYAIAANTDIANQNGDHLEKFTRTTNWIGNADSASSSWLGLKFTGPAIPAGSQIASATLQVTCSVSDWEVLKLAIYAEKNANPQTYSSTTMPSQRARTTAFQSLALDQKWKQGQTFSFDVTAPVKELVQSGGMVNGKANLIAQGTRKAFDYYFFYNNQSGNSAPKLLITYVPSGPLPPATTATAGPTLPAPSATAVPTKRATATPVTPAPTKSATATPVTPAPTKSATATPVQTAVPTATSVPPTGVWKPALNTPWQWQLTVPVDLSVDVPVYDIDGFDNDASVVAALHAKGRKVICYIDVGVYESYRPDANKFPKDVIGNPDVGWDNSWWMDIRRIDVLGPIMEARMDMCKAKGFDAIEPDEIDGYSNNPGFPLTYQDQLNYNIWIANAAHARGMSIGLKGDIDQAKDLEPYFDWTLNEECFQYKECNLLQVFINKGKAVFQVEYKTDPTVFCPQANAMNFNSMKKHLNLDAWRTPCR